MKWTLFLLLLLSNYAWSKWSVTTYNIRNFDKDHQAGKTNIAELQKIMKSMKSDVIGFQEVVNVPAFENLLKRTLPGYGSRLSSCGGFGKQNLALVYDQSTFAFVKQEEDLTFSSNNQSCGSLRPLLLITLKHKQTGENYIFGLVHLKAGGDERAFRIRWSQYQKLQQLSQRQRGQNLILLGDFNTTGYNIRNEDYVRFENFMSSSGFRTSAEQTSCTNYWDGRDNDPNFISSILDHIVIPDKTFRQVQQVRVGGHCEKMACRPALPQALGTSFQSVSDHCPVQVTFR